MLVSGSKDTMEVSSSSCCRFPLIIRAARRSVIDTDFIAIVVAISFTETALLRTDCAASRAICALRFLSSIQDCFLVALSKLCKKRHEKGMSKNFLLHCSFDEAEK